MAVYESQVVTVGAIPEILLTTPVTLLDKFMKIELMTNGEATFDIAFDVQGNGQLWLTQGTHTQDDVQRLLTYFGKGITRITCTKTDEEATIEAAVKITVDDGEYGYTGYCEPQDVRDYTNLESKEYTDPQLYNIIHQAAMEIDRTCNRIWGRTLTETDEYYDGNGNDELLLNRRDIQSITSLEVDVTGGGTFDTITPSSVKIVGDEARIFLTSSSEQSVFGADNVPKAVRITYEWGNDDVPSALTKLNVLMATNLLYEDDTKSNEIESLIKKYRSDVITQI
jgi:hypothetical protein